MVPGPAASPAVGRSSAPRSTAAAAEPFAGPAVVGTVTGEPTRHERPTRSSIRRATVVGAALVVVVSVLTVLVVDGWRAAGTVVVTLLVPLLAALALQIARFATRDRPGARTAQVRRYRITEPSGQVTIVELMGTAQDDEPGRGAVVEVYGTRESNDVVRARELVVVATQAVARARRGTGGVIALVADLAVLLIGVAFVATSVVVLAVS